jgi:TetR/AcrR family transcriptional regulator, transcriptional repressor for nem operon
MMRKERESIQCARSRNLVAAGICATAVKAWERATKLCSRSCFVWTQRRDELILHISIAETGLLIKSGERVSYPVGHRDVVKGKIIQSARRLFNRHGFDNVSIQKIMSGAGLTHGGFYSYFRSKSDLYTNVLECFFTDPEWTKRGEGVEMDAASSQAATKVVKAYLSRQHFEDVESLCPMVALPTDVRCSSGDTKRAFETAFAAMVAVLERSVTDEKQDRRAKAQAVAALCVGGMVVARAIENRVVADELRDACMSIALRLGGWVDTSALKSGAHEELAEECLAAVG